MIAGGDLDRRLKSDDEGEDEREDGGVEELEEGREGGRDGKREDEPEGRADSQPLEVAGDEPRTDESVARGSSHTRTPGSLLGETTRDENSGTGCDSALGARDSASSRTEVEGGRLGDSPTGEVGREGEVMGGRDNMASCFNFYQSFDTGIGL